MHPDAPAGKSLKYARWEVERRYLVAAPSTGAPESRHRIEDRYIAGTRLRLRRVTELAGDGAPLATGHKLTQKVDAGDATRRLTTNVYLSPAEYDVFATLPAATLHKVRSRYPPFAVDEFEGPLADLVLAEAELAADGDEPAPSPTLHILAEVTEDERFTGGQLALSSAADLAAVLQEFRLFRLR